MTPVGLACACTVVVIVIYATAIVLGAIASTVKDLLPLALAVLFLIIWTHSQDIKLLWLMQRLPQVFNEVVKQL